MKHTFAYQVVACGLLALASATAFAKPPPVEVIIGESERRWEWLDTKCRYWRIGCFVRRSNAATRFSGADPR